MGHRFFAALYDRTMALADEAGLADRRRRLLTAAKGRVLEVGAGTGLNLAYYRNVTELHLVEPDSAMARRLARRLGELSLPAVVYETAILEAELPAAHFDTVVCSLVLCSVPDPQATLARLDELLAPDGRILFLEHVRGVGRLAWFQGRLSPLWRRVAAGCHPDRDTLHELRKAGFAITDCDRFRIRKVMPLVSSGVAGVARRRVRPAVVPSGGVDA